MKKIFILTYCVLVPLLLTAAEKLMFERFNMDDALPGMDITSLEMMPGGMLRVVTNKGCILVTVILLSVMGPSEVHQTVWYGKNLLRM